MASEWIMVRLRRSTHERLTRLRARLQRATELCTGSRAAAWPDDAGLDVVVETLLAEAESHLERSAAARKRRAEKRRAKRLPEETDERCARLRASVARGAGE